jgi:hypothetical protein
MSHYIMIRRLRGPAFLLLVGALALLNQADILLGQELASVSHSGRRAALAERAALAAEGGYPPVPYPGAPYPGAVGAARLNPAQPGVSASSPLTAYYGKDSEGGQS